MLLSEMLKGLDRPERRAETAAGKLTEANERYSSHLKRQPY